jgi:excisionase family DNA binding protein
VVKHPRNGHIPPGQLTELKFLTVAEVAAIARVSKMTVYRLVHTGTLESIRVGGSFRIPEPAVRDYLGGHVTTLPAAAADAGERLPQAGRDAPAMPPGDPDNWIRIAARAGATAEEIAEAGGVQVGHVRQVLDANGGQW